MSEKADSIIPVAVEDEIKESYLNYAMSVIVSRALPDVRDGLKPVHRRILYSMNEMGLHHNRPFRKSVRVVGDVLAKYHPHGDQSVYDALVRLAQFFSLRLPVIDSQGNFGSIDGDPPAAMRYTEARMASVAEAMLRDIKKDTVDFIPNFDDSTTEPSVLPGAFPFLLVNGGSGIAVGMATNIPPHNLRETCRAICALIENPALEWDDLLEYVKGPDFPTGAIIHGIMGIRSAAKTGRGRIVVRAKHHLEELRGDREAIIVTEIPYMVNKASMIVKIADLVREKKIDGISDLRDESDRDGIRVVIELKRGASPQVVLNHLYAHTSMQSNFSVNNLALDHGKPKLFNLKEMIESFIAHRKEVTIRRINFDLAKAKERAHILEGLKIALDNIDEVIEIIKKSPNVEGARENLISRFSFSEKQAQAILDMRLQKLTSLETQKIVDELKEVQEFIAYLEDLLANEHKIMNIIKEETEEVAQKYGDERRTEISSMEVDSNVDIGDFIKQEDMVILISHKGFVKRIPVSEYKEQARGGKGSRSGAFREDDFFEHIFVTDSHTNILFITNKGKAYYLKAYELPEGSKQSMGRHLRNLFQFDEDEEVTTSVPLSEFRNDEFLFMATKKAVVKRVATSEFRNARQRGVRAIRIDESDRLISAVLTRGNNDIILITKNARGLRFKEDLVRAMGRIAYGVRGIKLMGDDELIGACASEEENEILFLTDKGFGKRMTFESLKPHSRGTMGQSVYKIVPKTGHLIGAVVVHPDESIIALTEKGKAIKFAASTISTLGRNTSGVRMVRAGEDDNVIGMATAPSDENSSEEDENEVLNPETAPDISDETPSEE